MTDTPKRKRMTRLQKRVMRARLLHPDETQTEIGRRVGAKQKHVGSILRKDHVKQTMSEIMDKAGLTDEFIAKKVKSLANAKTTKFFAHEGRVVDEKTVDDNGTQLAATSLAADIKGHKQKKVDLTSNGNSIKALLIEDTEA
jgi:NCAIR mutase (PurE)-related protein